jgi:hypothetical protein
LAIAFINFIERIGTDKLFGGFYGVGGGGVVDFLWGGVRVEGVGFYVGVLVGGS